MNRRRAYNRNQRRLFVALQRPGEAATDGEAHPA